MKASNDDTPTIAPENFWREVWHTNCPKWMEGHPARTPTSGVMRRGYDYFRLADRSNLRLFECLHCGVKVYAGLDTERRVVVRTAEWVKVERWIRGFRDIARTLALASVDDRANAMELLQVMGTSEEEMAAGEDALREMISEPHGGLRPMWPGSDEQIGG